MIESTLAQRAARYVHLLAAEIGNRRVGAPGNRQATEFFAAAVAGFGWQTARQPFTCIDWVGEGARLEVAGADAAFTARPSPYSLGCHVQGPLTVVETVDELAAAELRGAVLLLRGRLAGEQLMPKHFPFYQPEAHQRIIALLEAKQPAAIVAATERNPELAGAVYPFPLIEDGDFDIPSVYITAEAGLRLATHAGATIVLESRARRIPAEGWNVVARRGPLRGPRLLFCAHIDAKIGTPGALDNAAGVATLLLLAELLAGFDGGPTVELLAMNGEDYYAASGELAYLADKESRLGEIALAVNIDGAGYGDGETVFSLYGCPEQVAQRVRLALTDQHGLAEGPPWYQSDHMVFAQNGVPAVALTTSQFADFQGLIAHSSADTPDVVDGKQLAQLARALADLAAVWTKLKRTT